MPKAWVVTGGKMVIRPGNFEAYFNLVDPGKSFAPDEPPPPPSEGHDGGLWTQQGWMGIMSLGGLVDSHTSSFAAGTTLWPSANIMWIPPVLPMSDGVSNTVDTSYEFFLPVESPDTPADLRIIVRLYDNVDPPPDPSGSAMTYDGIWINGTLITLPGGASFPVPWTSNSVATALRTGSVHLPNSALIYGGMNTLRIQATHNGVDPLPSGRHYSEIPESSVGLETYVQIAMFYPWLGQAFTRASFATIPPRTLSLVPMAPPSETQEIGSFTGGRFRADAAGWYIFQTTITFVDITSYGGTGYRVLMGVNGAPDPSSPQGPDNLQQVFQLGVGDLVGVYVYTELTLGGSDASADVDDMASSLSVFKVDGV